MPLLLLAFGFGDASKIALVAIAVFFPVCVNTYVGASNIEKIYWDVAKNYGASQTVMFTRIVFFGALPTMFAGLRIALAVSFIVLVAAEFVATKSGLGYLIWNSWELLQVDIMFCGIVTIGILGLITSALFQETRAQGDSVEGGVTSLVRQLPDEVADDTAAGVQIQVLAGLARALLAFTGIELAGLKLDQVARDIREAPAQRQRIAILFQLDLQHRS